MQVVASIVAGVAIVVIVALLGFILRSSLWIAGQMKAEEAARRHDERGPRLDNGDDE